MQPALHQKNKTLSRQSFTYHELKSLIDIVLSLSLLAFLSPLLLTMALLIKVNSRGPILFTQTRIGRDGERFRMFKFRSMLIAEDQQALAMQDLKSDREGVCKKFKKDPRITAIGRFMRKLSIDELPQLLNVIRGEMSLVGPRPALPEEVECYSATDRNRLNAVPGISGLWQVSGRADLDFETQVKLDCEYINTISLSTDLKIMLLTIPAVISGKGAY